MRMPHLTQQGRQGLVLSACQKEQYAEQGFLVLKDFVSAECCELLMQRAKALIHDFDAEQTKTFFSTKDQCHAKHRYFLDSGDKICFFFEENALDENGSLTADKALCINKIGHALHDLDPLFNCFSRTHKLASLAHDLQIQQPLLLQSMYICKQPFIGGEVTCHQDSSFLFVQEQPVTGLWFALQDATLENGCLWAIPGGHRTALKSRMLRDNEDNISYTVYDDSPWPLEKMLPLEVKRGSLILLHGLLPHMSKENHSSQSRHAYTLHLFSGRYHFPADNWLRRKSCLPFSGFL